VKDEYGNGDLDVMKGFLRMGNGHAGLFGVYGHGNQEWMEGHLTPAAQSPYVIGDFDTVTPETLSVMIRTTGSWREGQPIFLGSCNTGTGKDSFAQHLANLLNTSVMAPTRDAFFFEAHQIPPGWGSGWSVYFPDAR